MLSYEHVYGKLSWLETHIWRPNLLSFCKCHHSLDGVFWTERGKREWDEAGKYGCIYLVSLLLTVVCCDNLLESLPWLPWSYSLWLGIKSNKNFSPKVVFYQQLFIAAMGKKIRTASEKKTARRYQTDNQNTH